MDKKNKFVGSNFDETLNKEGILAETEALALKRVITWKLGKAMEERKITKTQVVKQMHTSLAAFDRLLDPTNTSVTLKSLERAAIALGKRVHIEFSDLAL
ncbi:MAG: Fis family transcriptional regulator [Caedibacter sp. 38-128]|nr:XRE family transcriptional regulator [Holosporales bacterium]OJX05124.1 MAG: Fis family transcriptional regulator [Caedibacter sp. 38-128]